jgi:hypothetical protein
MSEKKAGERKGKAAKPSTKTTMPKPVDLKQTKAHEVIAAASQPKKPTTQGFVFGVRFSLYSAFLHRACESTPAFDPDPVSRDSRRSLAFSSVFALHINPHLLYL